MLSIAMLSAAIMIQAKSDGKSCVEDYFQAYQVENSFQRKIFMVDGYDYSEESVMPRLNMRCSTIDRYDHSKFCKDSFCFPIFKSLSFGLINSCVVKYLLQFCIVTGSGIYILLYFIYRSLIKSVPIEKLKIV